MFKKRLDKFKPKIQDTTKDVPCANTEIILPNISTTDKEILIQSTSITKKSGDQDVKANDTVIFTMISEDDVASDNIPNNIIRNEIVNQSQQLDDQQTNNFTSQYMIESQNKTYHSNPLGYMENNYDPEKKLDSLIKQFEKNERKKNKTSKNIPLKKILIDNQMSDPKKNPTNILLRDFIDVPKKSRKKKIDDKDSQLTKTESDKASNIKEENSVPNTSVVAPQIKIAPDGTIMIDEESLSIIKKKPNLDAAVDLVESDENPTYKKTTSTKYNWNLRETIRFYQVLSIVGTDFQLMTKFFPNLSRNSLKKKFKNEEKKNNDLIDHALKNRLNLFTEEISKRLTKS